MDNQVKEKKKQNKKNYNPLKDKLDSLINEDIKSIERSRYYLKYIIEIIKDFLKISETYNNKLQSFIVKLLPEELAKKKINTDEEIEISKYFQNIIQLICLKITNMTTVLSEYNLSIVKDIDKKSKLESTLNSKKNEFLDNYLKQTNELDTLNSEYAKEFGEYEDYLINKYSGLIDKMNKDKIEDKNKNRKKESGRINEIDNSAKTKEIQDKMLVHIENLNNNIKENFKYFDEEKLENQKKIYDFSTNFLDSVLKGFFAQNEYTKEINEISKIIDGKKASEKINKKSVNKADVFLSVFQPYSLKFIPNKVKDTLTINNIGNSLNKDLTYDKILNIIKEIKSNELLMCWKDIEKSDEIKKIVDIERYIDLLFENDFGDKENEEKKNLLFQNIKDIFKLDVIYRLAFVQYLNNKRAKGKLDINKKASENLGNILLNISKYTMKEKDYSLFKIISILSMTYYFIEDDKKIYISKYINKCEELNNKQFWIDYLKTAIDDDLKKSNDLEKPLSEYSYKELKNMKSQKLNILIYSNIISIAKIMIDFNLSKEFVIEWTNIVVDNILYIEKSQKNEIIQILNDS